MEFNRIVSRGNKQQYQTIQHSVQSLFRYQISSLYLTFRFPGNFAQIMENNTGFCHFLLDFEKHATQNPSIFNSILFNVLKMSKIYKYAKEIADIAAKTKQNHHQVK